MTDTHPDMLGTEAAACPECYAATFRVALDCAYQNAEDTPGVDPYAVADDWAAGYVTQGDVSAYYCHRHDPINAGA